MAKFYEFNQNNSGGGFDVDDKLCDQVYIEADSVEEANRVAASLGIYFNGADDGIDCECCGDRWTPASKEAMSGKWELGSDKTVAEHFDNDIVKYAQYSADKWGGWTTPDARIFYNNGEIKEIFRKETVI